jgi:hypothetical protein
MNTRRMPRGAKDAGLNGNVVRACKLEEFAAK